ncbi:uncharacterized protein CPUR_07680 [Claviceps purpurea 20.1]|uniref:F-box domain-containing protein n=1 Tax=Claviceps purpurea (strain 20.1) TaxID=1111077 RepID=M1WI28_CLAP2|nr:uncharacterized protein CPUR_07680 [Claviceps purpurea 20.1]
MHTLTSPLHGQLWRNINIIFPYPRLRKRSPASYLDLLKRILSWAGDGGFRKIDIALNYDSLTQADFTLLLNASPRLEHLEVSDPWHFSLPSKEKIWNRLRHVTINGCLNSSDPTVLDLPGQFPYGFLQNAASSLEHLTFEGVPRQWYGSEPLIPHLTKLKSLHIGGWYPLAIALPRIEQLWIGPNIPNMDPGPVAPWRDKWEGVWPHLKVLIFDASMPADIETVPFSGLRYLMCLHRGNSLLHLRFIYIHPGWENQYRDIFGNNYGRLPNSDVIRHTDFRNLRSVRSDRSMWILPDRARTLLSKSIENGQLTSFDITFPHHLPTREIPAGDSSVRHLEGYDWLRGAPSIHTLGCYAFRFRLNPRNDEDLPLPQFLATFPNLRTLRIRGQYDNDDEENEFSSLILAIISVTRLKTIHTTFFEPNSKALRKLRKAAHFKGVQISTADDDKPEQWPIPLGP